ncbi:hypothetical protein CRG98_009440 [Punica granatum]|uniref:Uncharacterized protein n=1 Tax=Punica granatum TaxID=22663 RepID=A0A2I0KPD4_PUNGR|nr:hypothetical protein CRG98_009440 [Punica granatum]
MGRNPLTDGRSGPPRAAAMVLRAAVLAPGRRNEGWNRPRFRPILEKIAKIRDLGVLGQRGSLAAGERCPALLGLPERFFFLWADGSQTAGQRYPALPDSPE